MSIAIKINDLVAKTAARVENTLEFSQKQHNTTLLGKYPLTYPQPVSVGVICVTGTRQTRVCDSAKILVNFHTVPPVYRAAW